MDRQGPDDGPSDGLDAKAAPEILCPLVLFLRETTHCAAGNPDAEGGSEFNHLFGFNLHGFPATVNSYDAAEANR